MRFQQVYVKVSYETLDNELKFIRILELIAESPYYYITSIKFYCISRSNTDSKRYNSDIR